MSLQELFQIEQQLSPREVEHREEEKLLRENEINSLYLNGLITLKDCRELLSKEWNAEAGRIAGQKENA